MFFNTKMTKTSTQRVLSTKSLLTTHPLCLQSQLRKERINDRCDTFNIINEMDQIKEGFVFFQKEQSTYKMIYKLPPQIVDIEICDGHTSIDVPLPSYLIHLWFTIGTAGDYMRIYNETVRISGDYRELIPLTNIYDTVIDLYVDGKRFDTKKVCTEGVFGELVGPCRDLESLFKTIPSVLTALLTKKW